jgi:outer membrane murein-binding lipoprotein Lpp
MVNYSCSSYKKKVFFVFILFVALWIILGAYLTGFISLSQFIPDRLASLALPKSTTELGDSLSILDGLFSSIAIVLGLVAIIFQGRELKESTKAQTKQANVLSAQMRQQEESNLLAAYANRLQFLNSETDRLSDDMQRLLAELKAFGSEFNEKREEKQKIFNNTKEKRRKYREQADRINEKLCNMLKTKTDI